MAVTVEENMYVPWDQGQGKYVKEIKYLQKVK